MEIWSDIAQVTGELKLEGALYAIFSFGFILNYLFCFHLPDLRWPEEWGVASGGSRLHHAVIVRASGDVSTKLKRKTKPQQQQKNHSSKLDRKVGHSLHVAGGRSIQVNGNTFCPQTSDRK